MSDIDVGRRLHRYHRSRNARDLWPDVSEDAFLAATRQIAHVTTAILTHPDRPPRLHADGDLARALPIAAFASGMGPLLGYWIERGMLAARSEVGARLAEHLDHGRRRAARLRSALEHVLGALHQRHIVTTVLKGMHTGWAYFPDTGVRPMADIDLLVEAQAAPDAAAVLTSLGFARVGYLRERTTWMPPGVRPPASVELTHVDNPWDLDLHVTLDRRVETVPARLGKVGPDDLCRWSVGSEGTRVLGQPLLTAYLALNTSSQFEVTSLIRLVELAQVIRKDVVAGDLSWKALAHRLETCGASPFVYPALELTEKLVPGTVDPGLRAMLRAAAPAAVRRVVDRATPGSVLRLHRRSLDTRLMWLSTWRQRAHWLWWRLWPHVGDQPVPPLTALRIQAERARQMVTGHLRWRRPD